MRTLLALICLATALRADEFDALYAQERTRVATDIAAYAKWCGKNGAKGSRDRAYEALLLFEPGHKNARRLLKYRWDKKSDAWVRRGKYTHPADRPGPAAEEATGRWRDLTELHARNVLKLIETIKDTRRAQALENLLLVAPDSFAARRENGELRVGDRWVLIETTTAPERRREIEQAARQALERAPKPGAEDLNAEDRKFGVPFPGAWRGRTWRGAGNVPQTEVQATVRVADAARPLFDAVFGGLNTKTGVVLNFYLLAGGKRAAEAALKKHPGYTDADREFAMALSGSWVPESYAFITWNKDPIQRADIVTRQATGVYMRTRFGITDSRGWIYEGVGLYFNYLLTGTRLTTSAKRTGYSQDPRALQEQERGVQFAKADWVELARRLFDKNPKPDLRLLVTKDVNTLSADDLLICYALTSYMLECRPKDTVKFLTAYGSGARIDDALVTHMGSDLPGFEKRVRRWMEERR